MGKTFDQQVGRVASMAVHLDDAPAAADWLQARGYKKMQT
jgi:hypothetical protein